MSASGDKPADRTDDEPDRRPGVRGRERPPGVPPPQEYAGPGQDPVPTGPPPPHVHHADGHPARAIGGISSGKLLAVIGPLSTLLFFVGGFVLDGWAWSWVAFLLPGIVYRWHHAD